MLLFIARWFKGLILGWILSLIFLMVRKMLERAFGGPLPKDFSQTASSQRSGRTNRTYTPQGDVIDTIWIGMTKDQLLQNLGSPESRVISGLHTQVWTYSRWNGQNTPAKVTLIEDKVSAWEIQKEADASSPRIASLEDHSDENPANQ